MTRQYSRVGGKIAGMWKSLRIRLAVLWKLVWQPKRRWLLFPFSAIGAWDILVAQFLPPELASKAPRVYDGLNAMSGWFPWYVWAIAVLVILLAFSIEFAVRRQDGETKAVGVGNPGPIQTRISDSSDQIASVQFTQVHIREKLLIKFEGVCPEKSGATLLMRLTSDPNANLILDRQNSAYELTGSGYPIMDMDLFGVPLFGPARNKLGDEISGWIEIDNRPGRYTRRDFRFEFTGFTDDGQYESSNGRGAFVGALDPISQIEFHLLPGNFAAGLIILE